jgi:hypothetical protein
MTNFHETYSEHDVAKASSARTFGLLIGALLIVSALRAYSTHKDYWPWLLGAGAACVVVASTRPALLAPLNRAWMALGKLLNRIVSPAALALLFFGFVWPIGALMRLAGSDPLRLKRAPGSSRDSCWIARDPLADDHFTRQF